jgi:hypothetical protein
MYDKTTDRYSMFLRYCLSFTKSSSTTVASSLEWRGSIATILTDSLLAQEAINNYYDATTYDNYEDNEDCERQ